MKEEIKVRTHKIAIEILDLVDALPNKPSSWVISKQIVRSATSVAANYRAVRLAKSKADFINKLKIVEEETDETMYWLELIEDAKLLLPEKLTDIKKEVREIMAIIVATIKTMLLKNS